MLGTLVMALLVLTGSGGAADDDHPHPPSRPEFHGTPASSSKPSARTVEEEKAKRSRERNTPDARAQRERSKRAHSALSKDEARALARRKFSALFKVNPMLVDQQSGMRIKRFRGDFKAVVETDRGERALALSTLPLRVKAENGEKKRPDLRLVARDGGFEPSQAIVPTRIEKDAAGGFAFEGTGVRVRPAVDEAASTGTEVDGKVFFSNVRTDADLMATATPSGLETFSILRSEDSPERQSFDFTLPDGARLAMRAAPAGGDPAPIAAARSAEVLDRNYRTIVAIAPPRASDADGEQVPVSYEVDGNRLTVQTDHRGGDFTYPIQVDPDFTVADYAWVYGADWDASGWWFNVHQTANPPCPWNNSVGSQPWNDDDLGLYGWLQTSQQTCNDGDWGEWLWQAPRSSRVVAVEYDWIEHWWQFSCVEEGVWGANRAPSPWWDGPTWGNCNDFAYGYTLLCMSNGDCNDTSGGSPGNVVVHKIRLWGSGVRSSAPITYLGAAAIYLNDSDSPVFETINHTPPSGWVDAGYYELSPRAHDDGVGMRGFDFFAPGHEDASNYDDCLHVCDWAWQPPLDEPFEYDVDLLPEGVNTLTVRAHDDLDKTTDHSFQVRVDRSGPTVSRSGSASGANAKLQDARYGIHADASDGSAASPRSGMKSLAVEVDGRPAGTGSSVNCSGYTCAIDWELVGERYAAGQHTLAIVATDQLDHVTRQEWEVTVAHTPRTRTSGLAA